MMHPVKGLNPHAKVSRRLAARILSEVYKKPFTVLARELGLDKSKVREVFDKYVERRISAWTHSGILCRHCRRQCGTTPSDGSNNSDSADRADRSSAPGRANKSPPGLAHRGPAMTGTGAKDSDNPIRLKQRAKNQTPVFEKNDAYPEGCHN
jgi:hypothetical protein